VIEHDRQHIDDENALWAGLKIGKTGLQVKQKE
jgi:hypothetical protein